MGFLIAVTGKGGVGKTTVSSLLVSRLVRRGGGPVLAVDADPNSCLDRALGVRVSKTVGGAREQARELSGKGMAVGTDKRRILESMIAESLVESDGFDLLAMGRPEGPGCYCYANNVLRDVISQIAGAYPVVVIDNEAGLENVSRRIVAKVDVLAIVTDPSRNGFLTVGRLRALAKEMDVRFARLALIVNRTRDGRPPAGLDALKDETGADIVVCLPENGEIAAFAEEGRALSGLSAENAVSLAVDGFLAECGLVSKIEYASM